MLRVAAIGVAASLLALSGCSSDDNGSVTTQAGATSAPTSGAAGPTISNFSFSIPDGLTAGTAFTVTNDDGTAHTFTNPDGAFDVSVPAGGTAEVTVAEAGTYTVVCKIHGSMKGTLTIG